MTNFSKLTFLSYQLFPILHTDWFFLFLVIIFFYPLLYKSSRFLSGMKPCGRRIATMAENIKRKTDTYTNTCEYAVIFFFPFFLFVAIKIPVAKSTFFFFFFLQQQQQQFLGFFFCIMRRRKGEKAWIS